MRGGYFDNGLPSLLPLYPVGSDNKEAGIFFPDSFPLPEFSLVSSGVAAASVAR